jgi:hypothetical protein
MPQWLQVLSLINPLSHEVDALRALLIGTAAHLWLDFRREGDRGHGRGRHSVLVGGAPGTPTARRSGRTGLSLGGAGNHATRWR